MTEHFPSWRYGPNGQAKIFNAAAEVPDGWHDHPHKVKAPAEKSPPPSPNTSTSKAPSGDAKPEIDAHGWPFDPKLHASTRTKTKAGLWRMAVGVTRPEPKAGFPKPALDL